METSLGAVGAMVGVGASIARDTNPVVSGIVGGARWFTLGGSYWCKSSPKTQRSMTVC